MHFVILCDCISHGSHEGAGSKISEQWETEVVQMLSKPLGVKNYRLHCANNPCI